MPYWLFNQPVLRLEKSDPEEDTGGGTGSGPEPGEEGYNTEVGGYSNPDGTVGYSGLQSGGRDDTGDNTEDGGNYPASVGANLAVAALAGELVADGLLAGLAVAGHAAIGMAIMGSVMAVEGGHAVWELGHPE